MTQPFIHPLIRNWLFDAFDISGNYQSVLIEGFSPFAINDFEQFLQKNQFVVFRLRTQSYSSCEILIVGQIGWSEDVLEKFIQGRIGTKLRIYSQEMFLSFLLSGKDPFDGPRELLDSFANGHPALEFLSQRGFDWPSTFIFDSQHRSELDESKWPKVGLLKYIGYTVGINGIKIAEKRQAKLKIVFHSSDLPLVKSRAYMSEWGQAGSCKRLKKMADSLATFCRNNKRRAVPPVLAISHWETDLDWMYKEFYSGRCSFSWPSTYVE